MCGCVQEKEIYDKEMNKLLKTGELVSRTYLTSSLYFAILTTFLCLKAVFITFKYKAEWGPLKSSSIIDKLNLKPLSWESWTPNKVHHFYQQVAPVVTLQQPNHQVLLVTWSPTTCTSTKIFAEASSEASRDSMAVSENLTTKGQGQVS